MTESPSELLTRAADLIRDTAAAATPGPWSVDDPAYVETISAEDGTAVVAVLETLAEAEKTYGVGTLKALAAEVKGEEGR